jgi:AbrB family looped-hinge helix DNA binding protein
MNTFITSITSKGQVTVPAEIRRKLGIATADKLRVKEVNGVVVLEKDDYWADFEKIQKKVQKHRNDNDVQPLSDEEITDLRGQSWQKKAS